MVVTDTSSISTLTNMSSSKQVMARQRWPKVPGVGVRRWSGAGCPLEMGLEEGVAERAAEDEPQGAENPVPAPSRAPKILPADGKHDGDLGDGLAVLDEDVSNAWWYQPGHAHPWDNFTRVGASCWCSDWAERRSGPGRLCCLCVQGESTLVGVEQRSWAPMGPNSPPARKPLSSSRCRRRCKAGLILVQIRCARPYSDNSPFLKASPGDCGKYVALIDC